MNEKYALECINVDKYYIMGSYKIYALRNVNIKVNYGDLVSIVGPSGSGKSTLLHVIGTLDRPSKGAVKIDSIDVTNFSESELSRFRREKIGFVFQFFNLVTYLTAVENVALPMLFSRKYNSKEAEIRAKLLLSLVGLPEQRFKNTPRQLSGGQQQMVAIARALANDPAVILADEPTGNLDLESTSKFLSTIRFLNEVTKKTFVIVTHNAEVATFTKNIKFIRDGIIYEKPPEDFLKMKVLESENFLNKDEGKIYKSIIDFEEEVVKRRFIDGEIDEETLENEIREIEQKRETLRL
ncbi:MAG: ABC transporter ATP-binding protein [Thermoproteota archaeon]|nr:ABC transporter ATP-binding protein [Candidatus Brockarchaeota archaeon]MBO3768164.1 ABC transporter ATP-binding protein [Candidatus Brockarchaeota archaeon]MBO3800867.1 ABC transporter ATP-binding protein [Candidatus Brockarchaeota archaeon]